MPLTELTIDLTNAEGVQLVLWKNDMALPGTSSWSPKAIKRTAESSGAHDFFQALRQHATNEGINLAFGGRYLSEDLNWYIVAMGIQAAPPPLQNIMATMLEPLFSRIKVEINDELDDIRSATSLNVFLTDQNGDFVTGSIWSDFVEKVVR